MQPRPLAYAYDRNRLINIINNAGDCEVGELYFYTRYKKGRSKAPLVFV